tara:strand:+ start:1023 stop:1217 length:195 start_codon:yes stop_codon:yes gene_type:complete
MKNKQTTSIEFTSMELLVIEDMLQHCRKTYAKLLGKKQRKIFLNGLEKICVGILAEDPGAPISQ